MNSKAKIGKDLTIYPGVAVGRTDDGVPAKVIKENVK